MKKITEYGLALVHTSSAYPKPWIGKVISLGKKGTCQPCSYKTHRRALQKEADKANDFWATSSKIIKVKITEI